MDADYQRLHQEAEELFHRFNDVVDDKAATMELDENIRDVGEEFEMSKNPRSIEDKIEGVISSLKLMRRGGSEEMDFSNIDELIRDFEGLRQKVRDLPNY